jgi:tetratricopeptide (TPR) repeat protein
MRSSCGWALCLAVLASCQSRSSSNARAASPSYNATTDGDIAVGNLEAQVRWHEQQITQRRDAREIVENLIALLLMRGQFLGKLSDYDRAEALADELVRANPTWAVTHLCRANVRATFHQFAAALADLEIAEKQGMSREATTAARTAIAQALGDYERAVALRAPSAKARPTLPSLGALASVAADRGDLGEAQRLFSDARTHFVDVSPFPLAALELQECLMLEKAGRLSEARDRFASAHARLPGYAAATSHLAAVFAATGERARAITLLQSLISRSDDPEYIGQLASLVEKAGDHAQAAALSQRASQRYGELLERHAEAFAAPAARFFMMFGQADRAVDLAKLNLENRPTADAYGLIIDALIAGNKAVVACDIADEALGRITPTISLHVAAARAYYNCRRASQGQLQLELAAR